MRLLYILALFAVPVIAQQNLIYVDSEKPGDAPCGIAVAHTQGGAYLLVGNHFDDKVTSFQLDADTGAMTLAGEAEIAPGSRPVALGFAHGRYAVVANQASSDLYVYRMNRNGQLSQVDQPVSTRGLNPAALVKHKWDHVTSYLSH
jgi:6-phosphogluconolactonase (cycloisomerase 2 family)